MDFLKRDNFILGLLIGLAVPIMAYGILLTLYDFLDTLNIISDLGYSLNFRTRTLALFAICANLLPFHYYKKQHLDNTMRGLVFPTMLFIVLWFVFYGRYMLNLS